MQKKIFNPVMYKLLNTDLSHLNDFQATSHYYTTGYLEKRKCDVNLPKDFQPHIYRALNSDLKHLTDIECKVHYFMTGKKENRLYKFNLPDNFDAEIYIALNKDLENLNLIEACTHYTQQGIVEKRQHSIYLPNDFDAEMYQAYNLDLKNLSKIQAKIHYMQKGASEKRQYKDPHFDKNVFKESYNNYLLDIRQKKNNYFSNNFENNNYDILLVNHDKSCYGANNYLYNLFQKLKKDFSVLLCEIDYQEALQERYNICKEDTISYFNDPTLLYMIYDHYKPKIFYLNSCNFAMYHIVKWIPKDVLVLHSHEIPRNYIINAIMPPQFVVSDRIAKMYKEPRPIVAQPFILDENKIIELSKIPVELGESIDKNKITICMCGSLTARKNYVLFAQIAKEFPQHNFLWIGGEKKPEVFNEKNIIHVPFTNNVYKYFKQVVDYFILFSEEDPCPYVILENILLKTKIIVFSENIYTTFSDPSVTTINGKINFDTCKETIEKMIK